MLELLKLHRIDLVVLARYMRILSEAYNSEGKAEFYTFVRSLDAAKESMKNGEKTLILDKSSPLAQIFYGY